MKHNKLNMIKFATTALAVACLGALPMHAMAAEGENSFGTVGVASIFNMDYSAEELVAYADAAQGSHWGYTNLGIANTDGANLNVREEPSTSGKLVGKMRNHAGCEVLEVADGWAKITSGEVNGYVSTDYLLMGADAVNAAKSIVSTVAIAKENGINIRQEPSTDSQIMTQIGKGEELEFIEDLEDWIHVSIDDEDAYVFSEYVTVETKLDTAVTMSELRYGDGVSNVRVDMVEYAKQFLGNPYKYGGTSLTKGIDCSAFVQAIYKKFGYKLERSSSVQSTKGTKISVSELKPGDLIFYSKNGSINHVAMYIGGGQVIHASCPKYGIRISKYNYRTPTKCVRMIND
ncbi:MAG: C40 family peptidase [Acetatifactor sp.]|nr:C40 family peptidase [Acetatifactor sp.]